MLKKLVLIASVMMLETTLYAGGISSCDEKNRMDCQKPSFDLSVTALYFNTYSSLLPSNVYSISGEKSTTVSSNAPGNWSGIIGGRYYLADERDVSLNWMYYDLDSRGTTQSEVELFTIRSNQIKINSVNTELAQSFSLASTTSIRLFAGLQYLNITNIFTITSSLETASPTFASAHDKQEGIGPRVGFDTRYRFKGNLSLFTNSAVAIVLARQTVLSVPNVSKDITIPELEAKLGVTYDKPFPRGNASLSAGWSVISYFNHSNSVNENSGINPYSTSNLTLSGPFVQAKWIG